MTIDVMFFKNNGGGQTNRVGGGYITIGGLLKTSYNLMKSNNGGLFVAYPSYKKADGTWANHVNPVNKEAGDAITQAVIAKYQEVTGEGGGQDRRIESSNNGNTRKEAPKVEVARTNEASVPTGRPF